MTDLDRLLYDMAKLADSDIPIDQGRVYNIGNKTIFYFSFFPYLSDDAEYSSKEILKQLSELKKYSLVIADFSYERLTHFPLYDVLEQIGINFVILHCNILNHQIRPNILHYPHHYHRLRVNVSKKIPESIIKKYKLSCLNSSPRWHRVYNYLLLQSHPEIKNFLVSMHNQDNELVDNQEKFAKDSMPVELIQQWNAIKNQLPKTGNFKININFDIKDPAYIDSYINLITETDMSESMFISEKTWKPIASAQLFLIMGYKNIMAHLKELGVDTFDDIVDHNYYDNEPDWQLRIQKIHQVINNLLSQDLESIYKNTQQRRISNAEKFFNGEFGANYQKNLIKIITQ
jgi:hypothetical protein